MESNNEKNIKNDIFLKTDRISSHLLTANIEISPILTKNIYKQTIEAYKKQTILAGLKQTKIPSQYLEENYKSEIECTLKNFLFKHLVLDFLMDQIRHQKITLANYPRLSQIQISLNKNALFKFDLSVAEPLELKEWKHFVFRAPKRKRYKDLDKQVALFLKREMLLFKKRPIDTVEESDWALIETTLLNEKEKPIFYQYKSLFWIKINNKYVTRPFQTSLLNKKIGDNFTTDCLPLENDFSKESDPDKYLFLITIKDITKGQHLSLDSFKTTFKLKSKADVHKKLIEVFSYRNDISQRKAIIEELFHLLLSKHRFEVPKHFVIRRQEDILLTLQQHPDYQVYKLQKDFFKQVEILAEKQLKEEILIDQIAYKENLKTENKDVQHYLHLFNNNRLKEFIYFKPQFEKIEECDSILQSGLLKQAVQREKTLNHIIHVLTK
jgi:FKBP-type peptidyl-prolyl cis-trans isomerase (trigger factor)